MADEKHLNIISSVLATGRGPNDWRRETVEKTTPVDQVQGGLALFLKQLGAIAVFKQGQLGDFLLEEMAFSAQVSPDGEFKLLGNNAADCSGCVRFVLRRRHVPETADLHLLGTRTDRYELKGVLGSSVDSDTVKVQVTDTVKIKVTDRVDLMTTTPIIVSLVT